MLCFQVLEQSRDHMRRRSEGGRRRRQPVAPLQRAADRRGEMPDPHRPHLGLRHHLLPRPDAAMDLRGAPVTHNGPPPRPQLSDPSGLHPHHRPRRPRPLHPRLRPPPRPRRPPDHRHRQRHHPPPAPGNRDGHRRRIDGGGRPGGEEEERLRAGPRRPLLAAVGHVAGAAAVPRGRGGGVQRGGPDRVLQPAVPGAHAGPRRLPLLLHPRRRQLPQRSAHRRRPEENQLAGQQPQPGESGLLLLHHRRLGRHQFPILLGVRPLLSLQGNSGGGRKRQGRPWRRRQQRCVN